MIKTGYSFKLATGHLADVMERLKEIEWKHAPICDFISTFGFRRWRDLCAKNNMKPVYGVCLPVSPDPKAKKPIHDHWSFYAKSDLRLLHDLVWKATERLNPALTYDEALNAEGVIKIAGHQTLLENVRSAPNLFFELSPATPKQLFNNARALGYNFVASSCNLYTNEGDLEFYRVAMGRRSGTQTYGQYILSDVEWKHAVSWFTNEEDRNKALINRDFVLEVCKAEMHKAELLHPKWTDFWDDHK